jgi:muramoyltetrapeptide carboxypeptidase LdcA involved in peptidoglycan recycling
MLDLIKPCRLKKGDKVATVSLSWGGAGDDTIVWRYYQGKERLEKLFGLEVVEMPHTLMGTEYVYKHPEKRAEDLMNAFKDPSIKAIISCTGGNDSIRMLPYIDFDVIRNNPKIFTGYSDTTVTHFMCMKSGISSFYGLSVLNDFAENVAMPQYTVEWAKRALFGVDIIGEIPTSDEWTSQFLDWIVENKNTSRTFERNTGYELLQGKGTIKGRLIGGCMEVIETIKGTSLFPSVDAFDERFYSLKPVRLCLLNGCLRIFSGITG